MLNRHLIAYLPVYLAQALVGFGSVAVFTRILEPAEYGRYVLILAGASLAATLLFTWLDAAIARHHARSAARGHLAGHLWTAWRLYAVLALIGGALAVFALFVLPVGGTLKTAIAFAIANTVIRSGLSVALETRRAAGEAWRYSLLETFTLSGGFALGVVFIMAGGMGAAGPFAGLALASLIALAIDGPVLLSKAKRDRADVKRSLTFFAYGAPVAVSCLFEHLLVIGDRFVIAGFLGEAATGAYAAGYGVADRSINILFLWLGATTGPLLISALEHKGKAAAQAVAQRTASLMALLGFPAAAGLVLVSEPAARVLIGPEIALAAASIMPFIAVAGLMNGIMTYYFHEAFVLGRQPRVMATVMLTAAAGNLVLNLILIPHLGIMGAAIATVSTYGAALIACIIIGRRIFVLPVPLGDWARAALATGIMAVAILALPEFETAIIELAVTILAGALSYGVAAVALNVADSRTYLAKLRVRTREAQA
jgi:O-antigen/teichoic acid export membrane protein